MASQWYVQVMGEVIGPYTSSELRQEAREGRITPDALVRKGDDGEWMLVDRIKGLFDASGQPVQRSRPASKSRARPDDADPRANGRKRRHSLVEEEEDEPEEAELAEDQRPPWFKKRFIFSTTAVLAVAAWLGYNWLSATQENRAIEEELAEPAVQQFDSVEEEMQFFGTRLKNLGATAESLNEQIRNDIGIALVPQTPLPEIEDFRESLDKSELELKVNYAEGISDSATLELLTEYINLILDMENARDGLEELKNNNPSVYKIKIYIEALQRVQTSTISNCIALYKLARREEAKQAGEG